MLAWACGATNGGLHTPVFQIRDTVGGTAYTWAFMNGLNVRMANGPNRIGLTPC